MKLYLSLRLKFIFWFIFFILVVIGDSNLRCLGLSDEESLYKYIFELSVNRRSLSKEVEGLENHISFLESDLALINQESEVLEKSFNNKPILHFNDILKDKNRLFYEIVYNYIERFSLISRYKSLSHRKAEQEEILERARLRLNYLKESLKEQENEFELVYASIDKIKRDRSLEIEARKRIERQMYLDRKNIEKIIERSRGFSTPVIDSGKFIHPVDGPITSYFGMRLHPILGIYRHHNGIDYGVPHGTAVRASRGGQVVSSDWMGGYGQTIIIQHEGGYATLYAHLSERLVSEGDIVRQGQVIGYVGSTGLSTGPHLHFEILYHQQGVDPIAYLK